MFYLIVLLFSSAYAQTIVNTTQGEVQGAQANDGNYSVFYGVHYAGSTSGANRFKAPPPPPRYPGVFHAIDRTVICAHPTPRGIVGVEDCLVLNIHTKNVTTPKPVMVILLGDEYSSIDIKQYSYRRLVESDVVVVTMNYRLSIFGFLCLGVPEAPGNAGLKDIVRGLQWIQDNIAGFGGDPNNVLLFGHGSGAAMVDLITLSPLATNLVNKAITQSGSSLAPWAIAYEPIKYAQVFAEQLSYTGETPGGLASKLITTDVSLLAPALQSISFLNNSVLFAPCIENKALNDTFLTEAPIDLIRSGNYSHIPFIAGYTDREGTIRAVEAVNEGWLERMQTNFTDFIQVDLGFNATVNKTVVANNIRTFYWDNRAVNMETITDYLNYHGDTAVVVSVIRGARERALTSRAAVRLLEFTYRGTRNSDWLYHQIPIDGVWHGAVLNYLFDYDLKPEDENARASLVRRFVSFASTGEPTNDQVTWLPINANAFNYLYYAGDSSTALVTLQESARVNPHSGRMSFWDNLYDAYYVRPPPVSSAEKIIGLAFVLALAQVVLAYL
ncbi:carboxylic ester hydrolase-like [Cydia pomonella]|uniref:carboxylic ester hydrolase-like n=1 Tax=Cydia pomonella TaxID=82600 RepID=UPI002ADE2FB7|nr:carboxylic ester hydrolase-like [Cydia pomonella]